MRPISSIYICLLMSCISFACNKPKEMPKPAINSLEIIYSLRVDSLKNIQVDWRQKDLLVVRFTHKDYPAGIPLLLKDCGNHQICCNVPKWTPLENADFKELPDSLGITQGRLEYVYYLMTQYPIRSIINYDDRGILNVKIDTVLYTKVLDTTYTGIVIDLSKKMKLKDNWLTDSIP